MKHLTTNPTWIPRDWNALDSNYNPSHRREMASIYTYDHGTAVTRTSIEELAYKELTIETLTHENMC
jgi:hypothetical protein